MACDTTWISGDGDWNLASNWSNGKPDVTTRTCITNPGTYNVRVTASASAASLVIGASGGQSPVLTVQGALLTVSSGFTNYGTIVLSYANTAARLTVDTGTLVNEGTIRSFSLSSPASILTANLDNRGTLDVQSSLTMPKALGNHANSGAVTIASGKTFSLGDQTLGATWSQTGGTVANAGIVSLANVAWSLSGGEIVNSGSLTFAAGSLTQTGGKIRGTSSLVFYNGVDLSFGPDLTSDSGKFVFRSINYQTGDGTIAGDIPLGDTVTIEGGSPICCSGLGPIVTATTGFSNRGTIILANSSSWAPVLSVTAGALINESTGTIRSTGTGFRDPEIVGYLDNRGLMEVQGNLRVHKDGSGTAPDGYAQSGIISVSSGAVLTLGRGNGSPIDDSPRWEQAGGTINVAGALNLVNARWTQSSGDIISSGSGTITLSGGTFTQTGGTVAGTNAVRITGGALSFPAGASGQGRFDLLTGARIAGVVPGGVTLSISGSLATPVSAPSGIVNHGQILLSAPSGTVQLVVPSGSLVNATTGTVQISGSGAASISASLENFGSLLVLSNTNFTKSGGSYLNMGAVSIAAAKGLTFNGAYRQAAGSTDLGGGSVLTATGSSVELSGGTLSGSGTVTPALVSGATLSPGGVGIGTITVTGSYAQSSSGLIVVDIGSPTSFDTLRVTGGIRLSGGISPRNSAYAPVIGDTFKVIYGSARTGIFTSGPDGTLVTQDAQWGYLYDVSTASLVVLPPQIPGAPRDVVAVPGTQLGRVAWSPPASNGGRQITSYRVTSSPDGLTCDWSEGDLACVVSGLRDDIAYTFSVRATNEIGQGPASLPSSPIMTRATIVTCSHGSLEDAVEVVTGDAVTCSVTLGTGATFSSWTADGFSPAGSDLTTETFAAGGAGSAAITATYVDDLGQQQETFQYTVLGEATVPGPPTDADAIAGNGTATVSWVPPVSTGGREITSYTVTSSPGGRTCSQSSPDLLSCVVTGLSNGIAYTFTVTASNVVGEGAPSGPSGEVIPAAPPTAQMTMTWAAFSLTSAVTATWSGVAGTYPISSYDVRFRRAPWNGGFSGYTTWLSGTTLKSASLSISRGYTYCLSVRARDARGLLSLWSVERCTTSPLDDRSFSRTSAWTASTGSSYYASSYLQTTRNGATLTRTGLVARRFAIVVTQCSTCGSIRVLWRAAYASTFITLKNISLYRLGSTANRQVIVVPLNVSTAQTGTLQIVVTSPSGRLVIIDGLGVRPN